MVKKLSILISESNSHFQQQPQRGRNENISFDMKTSQLLYDKSECCYNFYVTTCQQ